jgi:hypothetical protein
MGVYTHNPRRDVNKYMHKREIDARFGEIGGRGDEPRLVHGVAGSYTTTENCEGKREWKMERAVFLKVHQQPIVIVIVIKSRYSHLQVMIGSMRHLRSRLHSATHTANPRHGTLGPDGRTRTECIWPLCEAPLANQCCVCWIIWTPSRSWRKWLV